MANLRIDKELERNNLLKLFEWKNKSPLSRNKKKVLGLTIENLVEINHFRKLSKVSEREIKDFFNFTSKIIKSGIVWRIFLLHIAKPTELPIIDRFTFKAVNFLKFGRITELDKEKQNINEYLEFRKFLNDIIKKSKLNYKDIDKALMAFGQFLNNPQKFFKG